MILSSIYNELSKELYGTENGTERIRYINPKYKNGDTK